MNRVLLAAAFLALPGTILAEVAPVQGLLENCGKETPERTIRLLEASGWVAAADNDFDIYASMIADSWTGLPADALEYGTKKSGASRNEIIEAIKIRRSEMFGDAILLTLPETNSDARIFLSVEGGSGRGENSAAGCFVVSDELALPAADVSTMLGDAKVHPKKIGVGTEQTRMVSDPTGNQRHRRIFASFFPDTVLEQTTAASRGNISLSITCYCD